MADDYVELASNILLTPVSLLGPYGYDAAKLQYPLEAVSALGYLKNPNRRTSVIEIWSPYEVALFEAAIAQYGKRFHEVQKAIETKTSKEVIEFYYVWKKTSHYVSWKKQYLPPHLDVSEDEEEEKKKS
jgi:hypothetical protein